MPTYNRGNFIAETLDSILAQTFESWECIIVDDNSIDNTGEVLKPYLQDDRFLFTPKPIGYIKGANASRNYGLNLSKGKYIYWFDSDDIIHPLTFELVINQLLSKEIDFCRFQRDVFYGDFDKKNFQNYCIDEKVFEIDKSQTEKIINNELPFNTCSLIWKKESLKDERFRDELLYAEEWEFYSRLVSNGLKGVNVNKVLIYARKHDESQTHEFNMNSFVRVDAKRRAALLIVRNLRSKQMLTYSIKRYFICLSIGFKEYNLFDQILDEMQLTFLEKFQWQIFYKLLPLRLSIYRLKKQLVNK